MSRFLPPISRRQAVKTVGATLAAAPFAHLVACSSDSPVVTGAGGAGGADGGGGTKIPHCTLTPELTYSPTWVDLGLLRPDIREGKAGATLVLTMTVLDSRTCTPLAGAAIDVWNASPLGDYSTGKPPLTAASTFLRGVQMTDAEGVVVMTTLYPGWYKGRSNHVHVKVHVGGSTSGGRYVEGAKGHICYVGQLFFPQPYNDEVRALSPYTSNVIPYVVNAKDHYYPRIMGEKPVFAMSKGGAAHYLAAITLVVDPTSTPSSGATDAGAKDAAPDGPEGDADVDASDNAGDASGDASDDAGDAGG